MYFLVLEMKYQARQCFPLHSMQGEMDICIRVDRFAGRMIVSQWCGVCRLVQAR
jgi:hypothetical protein